MRSLHFCCRTETPIPHIIEYGGSLCCGRSPISQRWLITKWLYMMCSVLLLLWSLSHHIIHHQFMDWFYWINNWSLGLSTIYLTLSYIATHRIHHFVLRQQTKWSNVSALQSPVPHSKVTYFISFRFPNRYHFQQRQQCPFRLWMNSKREPLP